jgi:MoxR-like ATPase
MAGRANGRKVAEGTVGGDGLVADTDQVFMMDDGGGPDQGHQGQGRDLQSLERQMFSSEPKKGLKVRDIEPRVDVGQEYMPSIGTEAIATVALSMAKAQRGVMFYGAPGIGKTSIMIELGQSKELVDWSNSISGLKLKEMAVVALSAPELNPEDLMGVPTIEDMIREVPATEPGEMPTRHKHKVTVWATPSMFDPTKPFILFVDEPNRCEPAVRNALFQLVTGKQTSSGFQLPAGSVVVAAGNRMEDRAGVRGLDNAWCNRFAHMNVAVSVPSWLDWAQGEGLSPIVRAFIHRNPSWLSDKFVADDPSPAKPTPRSWEAVGRAYADPENSPTLKKVIAESLIGKQGAQLLHAFSKHESAIPDPDMLRKDPDSIQIPKSNELDLAWALSMALADQMTTRIQVKDGADRVKSLFSDPLALGISTVLKKLVLVNSEAALYSLEAARKSIAAKDEKSGAKTGAGLAAGSVFLAVCANVGADPRFKQLFDAIIKTNK